MYASPQAAVAQESTPEIDNQVGGQFVAIYEGTCDSLTADSVHDLGEAFLPGTDDEEGDDNVLRGSTDAVAVLTVDETIETTFGDLLDDGEHTLVVHATAGDLGTIVACGAIGGVVDDGRLVVGLLPVDNSGIQGVAVFDEDEEGFLGLGDDEVHVRVYLLAEQAISADDVTAGAATPEDASAVEEAAGTVEAGVEDAAATAEDVVEDVVDDEGTPETEG
jgi:hypothetical protein